MKTHEKMLKLFENRSIECPAGIMTMRFALTKFFDRIKMQVFGRGGRDEDEEKFHSIRKLRTYWDLNEEVNEKLLMLLLHEWNE